MRKSRFAEPQIMAVLRQAESGATVPELCREHGISTASFYIYGRLSLGKRFELISEHDGRFHSLRKIGAHIRAPC